MKPSDQKPARILVVEDDAIIALDLAGQLTSAGYFVVGPASNVDRAMKLLDRAGCDAAVLDIHLGRTATSEPIAERLIADAIPFLTVTGYGASQRPATFADVPLLTKPVHIAALVVLLDELLNGPNPTGWVPSGQAPQ